MNRLGAAVCGGIFVVPLIPIIQAHSPDAERARTLAANNIISAGGVAAAMAVAAELLALHVPVVALIALLGAGTLGVSAPAHSRSAPGERGQKG